jgi:molybdopterin-binding protein
MLSGERVRVLLDTKPMLVAEVTPEAVASLSLREGTRVYAAFKATGVLVASCQSAVASCQLPVASRQFYSLATSDWRLATADCRLATGD